MKRMSEDLIEFLEAKCEAEALTDNSPEAIESREHSITAARLADTMVEGYMRPVNRPLTQIMVEAIAQIPEMAASVMAVLVALMAKAEENMSHAEKAMDHANPALIEEIKDVIAQVEKL